MTYQINNEQKLNDLIFANRNQAYGAYAIRSSYGETILKSLSLMIFGVSVLVAIAYFMNHKNDETKLLPVNEVKDSVYTIPVYLKPEEPIQPEENKPAEMPTPIAKPVFVALSTNFSDSSLSQAVDTTLQQQVVTSTLTQISTEITGLNTGSNSVTTTNTNTNTSKEKNSVKGALEVDSPPEFEGGLNALNKFIASQLRYPDVASREGQEGKVYVRFVVDENGKVGDLMLLNRVGFGMDEEALRVVNLIPNFKSPAKVKGEPVKAYYQVPIRFHYR